MTDALFILGGMIFGFGMLSVGYGWPRRMGNHPHCATCDYDLSHRASDRCPECGAAVTGNWVKGRRHVRRDLIWLGIALMAVGLAISYGRSK